jgi:hypothetical protein
VRVRLNLEPLEDRTLPATITWIAGSGNFDVGSNWSGGVVPGPNDVAVIDTGSTAATITIQYSDNLQVQAINTASADTLAFTPAPPDEGQGGALTVTAGSSTLNGPLSMDGGFLTANGSGASLTANGRTTLADASLFASGGAQLSLPTATSYADSLEDRWQASGPGSILTLGALTSLTNFVPPEFGDTLDISATAGGQVQLPAVTTFDTTSGGENTSVSLSADGAGSVINVSALTTLIDTEDGDFPGVLSVTNGGTVLDGALTTLENVDLTLDGTSTLAVGQWSAFTNGTATISGGTHAFTNLANIEGSSFAVSGGAQVLLPAVTGEIHTWNGSLAASGSGSTLVLPALTSIAVDSSGRLGIGAAAGGQIQLPALTAIRSTGSEASIVNNGFGFGADGTGSVINVPALTTFTGNIGKDDPWSDCSLNATHGGTVLDSAMTNLNAVNLDVDGTGTVTVGVTLGGASAGSYAGLIEGSNPINLNGTRLQVAYAGATPAGTLFSILAPPYFPPPNYLDYMVSGMFQGLPDGAVVTATDGTQFSVSYRPNGPNSGINSVALTQLATIGPTITSFNPMFGPPGAPVTITGTQFTGATAVAFGGVAATAFTVNSDTQITATVPAGVATGPITVTTPNGTAMNTTSFSVAAPPTISGGFAPGSGSAGSQVFIYGTNFFNVSAVTFNGVASNFFVSVSSPAFIDATVPSGATSGLITVTTPYGSASSAASFTVTSVPPTITAIAPGAGPVGSQVVITGTNLYGASVVAFNGVASAFVVNSPTQITATVPSGATNGAITVTTPSGTAASSTNFAVGLTSGIIATGADAGGGPQVNVYDANTNTLLYSFFAYDPSFTGGVRVALGDVTGDGIPDIITGAGPGGGSDIKIFDGQTGNLIREFSPFNPLFTGSQYIAAADLKHQGYDDIIVGADYGGGPNVIVFDGKTGAVLYNFFAYDPNFIGGVRVAAGDVLGNGQMDIICGAGPGGGARVTVFQPNADGTVTPISSFFAYDPAFDLGIYVAAGDVAGNGKDQIITGAGAGGGPNVSVFDGSDGALIVSFFAYDPGFVGGVRVAAAQQSNGNVAIVTTAGPGGGAQVTEFNGASGAVLDSFFAYNPLFNAGLWVAGA